MTQRAGTGLVRLGDLDFVAANPEDDIRGKSLYDLQGQHRGSVEDVYMDRRERTVRFLEVRAGGLLGIGERHYLVPVEAVMEVSEDSVTIEPDRTQKVVEPAPSTPRLRPLVHETGATKTTPRCRTAHRPSRRTPRHGTLRALRPLRSLLRRRRGQCRNEETPSPRFGIAPDPPSRTAVRMQADPKDVHRPEASEDGGGPEAAVWGVTGLMGKDILPDEPAEHRKRNRLRALRAMDRLGLLDEGNLVLILSGRPELRWLADEVGARWGILVELGRISDPGIFEEALRWALENRPSPEQARAYIWRFRTGAVGPEGV